MMDAARSGASTEAPSSPSPATAGRPFLGLAVCLAMALAVAGCNASQGVDASSSAAPKVTAGPYFPNYNPYNPVAYAQTSGIYGGR